MPTDVQTVENPSAVPLKVWLEPWAEYVELPPKSTGQFEASSDEPGQLEIELSDVPVVYGWAGSSLKVLVGGVQIWVSHAPSPPLPKEMGMRDFVSLTFGKGKG